MGFLTVSLFALPVYGQTLSDFKNAVLSPIASQAAHEQAETKRKTLTKIVAQAVFQKTPWAVLGAIPTVKEFIPALEALSGEPTIEQLESFQRVMFTHIESQSQSRKEIYLSELLLKTTAKQTNTGAAFSVCNEKIARTWKYLITGTFQREEDHPC